MDKEKLKVESEKLKTSTMDNGKLKIENEQRSTERSRSMPKNWKYGTLEDAVNKGSSNISLNKIKDEVGEYPVFKAKGFAQNVSFFHQEKEYLAIIKDGAGIGRVSKHPAKSSVVATMQYLIPKENFDIGFIQYFLNGIDFQKHRKGSTIPHVYFKDYKSEPFPLLELIQQKQIVKIVDQAFTAIDKAKNNAQQNLLNAKQLFESVLNGELLVVNGQLKKGWTERTLEQIAETFGRGKSKHRPRNDKKLYGGNYPFIQTGDIRNSNHFITNYTQTYNEVGLAQSKLWPKGTICITIAANIAETGVLSFDACFPDSVIGIVVNPEFANIDFVEYLLQSFKVNLQSLSKGSAQDNLNLGTFKNKLFPFPPLKEQQKIVKKLNTLQAETKKLESIYEQKIADLEELKKSVLQKAFNGQLTVDNGELKMNEQVRRDNLSPSKK